MIMASQIWWLPVLWVAVMLMACGRETPVPTPGIQQYEMVIPTVSPDVLHSRELLSGSGHGLGWRYPGPESIEETILEADVIARVDYLSNRVSVAQDSIAQDSIWWVTILEFRFRVNEYLKGSGPAEIGGIMYMYYETEADARAAQALTGDAHDDRWDTREAIVFLDAEDSFRHGPQFQAGPGQYWFGLMGETGVGFVDTYTVASEWSKLWLPEATELPGGARSVTSPDEKVFLLDVPATSTPVGNARGASAASVVPTISLGNLKSRIAALEAEANAGGTPEYRRCVELNYQWVARTTYSIATYGLVNRRLDYAMASGLPAGTVVFENDQAMGLLPDRGGLGWFDGPDKDVMRYEYLNFRPWGPRFPDAMRYSQRMVTARPLPAGDYVFYPNWLSPTTEICNKDWSIGDNRTVAYLAVTAPSGTVHEAFFDPVAIGAAIGADGSNGVLKPAAFTVGGASATITSLKWEAGVVTMELNPSASLAGHAVDFIALDGSVTSTLSFDDATQGGGGALTWSVANQPWQAGDLLMLRIGGPAAE